MVWTDRDEHAGAATAGGWGVTGRHFHQAPLTGMGVGCSFACPKVKLQVPRLPPDEQLPVEVGGRAGSLGRVLVCASDVGWKSYG